MVIYGVYRGGQQFCSIFLTTYKSEGVPSPYDALIDKNKYLSLVKQFSCQLMEIEVDSMYFHYYNTPTIINMIVLLILKSLSFQRDVHDPVGYYSSNQRYIQIVSLFI